MSADSRVVDALHEGQALERVLEALGCDTRKDNGSAFESPSGFIHCPMPDHADKNPSCTVRQAMGQLHCHSLCDNILPADLVIAHGVATDRAEAMKWMEKTLGIEPVRIAPVPVVDDPSLTVEAYLARKGLPPETIAKFGLQTVRIWQAGADKGTQHASYETGWYDAVFMPTREGRRPRVRSDAPGRTQLKWAPKVRFADGSLLDFQNDDADPTKFKYPLDVIGMDQLEPTQAEQPNVLVVVEGESDVHAMHAMQLPGVVGVPGAKMSGRVAMPLLEACIIANQGDTDLRSLTVLVWQEPGSAGAQFPKRVADAIGEAALQHAYPAPVFGVLHYGAVAGQPKDPAALLQDRPLADAREHLEAAIIAALPQTTSAASIADSIPAPPPPDNIAPALLPAQVDGLHTPPPLTVSTILSAQPSPAGAGDGDLPAELGPGWSAESNSAPIGKVLPGMVAATEPIIVHRGAQAGVLWPAFDELEDPPARDLAPERVQGISSNFIRTDEGWSVEKIDKDGDATLVAICTAFVVERVERCAGEILVRVAAPFGGAWNRSRLEMSATADAGRTCGALASLGVSTANRQRASVTDLLLALAMRCEAELGAVHVPSGTGWSGRPGSSEFGGIEVEPVNDFGVRMFEANERRRTMYPDTLEAAQRWWNEGVAPIIGHVEGPSAVAPMLMLGAAAAACLVGPLMEVGVAVSPVVWVAGLGGGGKSVTQKLAASIYAPTLPDLDGQSAYFANANMSQAALSARVDSCRDLPLILDDVTQLPPLPGSTSRGDAARIEAAAALGMLVFNRKPIERATRDGGIRATKPFRSSAIFSAEVSMSSESSKAVVTAGMRRRISTIEARPMTERGLAQEYAEGVNRLSATVGGAPGELLVRRVRDIVAGRDLRALYDDVRRCVAAMPEAREVTMTQIESLAVNILSFGLLAQVCGVVAFRPAIDSMLALSGPYLEVGAGAGGATRDSDLSGVDAAMRSVDDVRASHPLRFDNQVRDEAGLMVPPPTAGYLGKELRALRDGTRRIAMLRTGMEMLNTRYGVTSQVIEQAISDGVLERKQVRMSDDSRPYAMVWLLPPRAELEPDEDPEPGFEHDPHGLKQGVRVPGSGASYDVEPNEPPTPDEYLDQVARWVAGRFERPLNSTEGHVMDSRFSFGSGLYLVGDGPSMRENVSHLKLIRTEARQELEALQMLYRHAAEKNPDYVIDVADFLADDDPRWSAIDGLGPDVARQQWNVMNEHLWARNQQDDLQLKRPHDEAYVKALRVHLMCRYRHPEWFVQGTDKP